MEGADRGGEGVEVEEVLDPFAHLPRRLVGEGHGGDRAGIDPQLLDQPVDAVGDDPGLADPALARTSCGPSPWVTAAICSGLSLRSSSWETDFFTPGVCPRGVGDSKAAYWQRTEPPMTRVIISMTRALRSR